MRIAEYKQTSTEVIESTMPILDSEGNETGEYEIVRKEVPIMSMVYRDMTADEIAQMEEESKRFEEEHAEEIKAQERTEKLNAIADLVSITTEPSDKLGFDWHITKVGEVEVKKIYVANPNAKGTESNPFTDKSVLVDNAYYLIDGVRYVYMQGQFVEF